MKKKLILTGATGFLGSLFLNLSSGLFEVVCVGRKDLKTENGFIQYNIENIPKKFLETELTIVHLATYYSKNEYESQKIKEANLEFGQKLLDNIDKNNIQKFIYTNTMFAFDDENKNYYYTKSKLKFAEELYKNLIDRKITEIFLDNTFHFSDTRNKAVPLIIESVIKNTNNPITNYEQFINLSFAPDVVNTLLSEIDSSTNTKSRITSSIDINISSIYNFLKDFKNTGSLDKSLLDTKQSKHLFNNSIPLLNSHHTESNIYLNLINTLIKGMYL
jgi:nucleoside-diphosphate-sugar epimerase